VSNALRLVFVLIASVLGAALVTYYSARLHSREVRVRTILGHPALDASPNALRFFIVGIVIGCVFLWVAGVIGHRVHRVDNVRRLLFLIVASGIFVLFSLFALEKFEYFWVYSGVLGVTVPFMPFTRQNQNCGKGEPLAGKAGQRDRSDLAK